MLLLTYVTLVIFGMILEIAVLKARHKKHVREYMAEGMTEGQAERILLQKESSML